MIFWSLLEVLFQNEVVLEWSLEGFAHQILESFDFGRLYKSFLDLLDLLVVL